MEKVINYKNDEKEAIDRELHELADRRHELSAELEAITNRMKILNQNGIRFTMEQIDHYFYLHGQYEETCSKEERLLVKSGRLPENNPLNPKCMWKDILMHEAGISLLSNKKYGVCNKCIAEPRIFHLKLPFFPYHITLSMPECALQNM